MPRRAARVAGLGARDAARETARDGDRPRDRPSRSVLPAANQLGPRPLSHRHRLGARGAARAPGRAPSDRALRGRAGGRAADDPRARRRPRRRRARSRAPSADPAVDGAGKQACPQPRRPVGGRRVPDRRSGRAGGDDARRVHGLRLRRLPARLGRRGGTDAGDQGAVRPGSLGPHSGRRHRPHDRDRGTRGRRLGGLPQHARRRGLLQPGGRQCRGRDHLRRVPGRLPRPRRGRGAARLPRRRSRRSERRGGRRVPQAGARDRRRLTTPGRAGSRLQSEDHPLHAQRSLRREDRRHDPPRRRARATPTRAERTRVPCTGTWSRTCARAAS